MGVDNARDLHLISSQELIANRLAESKEIGNDIRVIEAETGRDAVVFAQDRLNPRQFNTFTRNKKIKDIVRIQRKSAGKDVAENGKLKPGAIEDKAQEFSKRNRELDPEVLKRIVRSLKQGMNSREIQELIGGYYPDPYLAHDVYDFVLESTTGEFQEKVRESKEQHEEQHTREIQIGQNISEQARSFEDKGLDSPTKLREWYQATVTSAPGQVKTTELFLKMLDRFGFEKLVKAVHFYLAALGADLRKKGLPGAELGDKVHQVRCFQAIIVVFRMSRMRMRVVDKALQYYAKLGTRESLPAGFDFQAMGRTLMNIVQNRHIHKDTILNEVRAQGFAHKEVAMSCVIQQMSLMLGDLDPNRIFSSATHKEDVVKFFKECLEFLYANAQPEEVSEWLSEEILPDGLENELIQDTAALHRELRGMENDPELKDFMKAFQHSIDLDGVEGPSAIDLHKKRGDPLHRLPLIAFMGSVRSGKTTLVDALSKTNFAKEELGAITQSMRLFTCDTPFASFSMIDTPGHPAYSSLRERLSHICDLLVLVVARDEGMQEAYEELLRYAKESDLPLVVVITKADKLAFPIEKIYEQMKQKGLLSGAEGGQIATVVCSSTTGEGLDAVAEMLAVQIENLDLGANALEPAYGVVLESEIEKGYNEIENVTTLLVQDGSLRPKDILVFDKNWTRVEQMYDVLGQSVEIAGPCESIRIKGMAEAPEPGQTFVVLESEELARDHIEKKGKRGEEKPIVVVEPLVHPTKESIPSLRCLVRGFSWSAFQALSAQLLQMQSPSLRVEIIDQGMGEISEGDVQAAAAAEAVVVGLRSPLQAHAEELSRSLRVTVCQFEFIYHVCERMKMVVAHLPQTTPYNGTASSTNRKKALERGK